MSVEREETAEGETEPDVSVEREEIIEDDATKKDTEK